MRTAAATVKFNDARDIIASDSAAVNAPCAAASLACSAAKRACSAAKWACLVARSACNPARAPAGSFSARSGSAINSSTVGTACSTDPLGHLCDPSGFDTSLCFAPAQILFHTVRRSASSAISNRVAACCRCGSLVSPRASNSRCRRARSIRNLAGWSSQSPCAPDDRVRGPLLPGTEHQNTTGSAASVCSSPRIRPTTPGLRWLSHPSP